MLNKRMLSAMALLSLPALFLFTACDPTAIKGNGDIVTESRDEKNFTGVEASIPGKIKILSGPAFKVDVQVEENLLPYLKTEVEADGNLHVYFSKNVRDVDGLVISVTMPALESLSLSGSAEIVAYGQFGGQSLDLDLSGSGVVRMEYIDYDAIDVQLSGSGDVVLNGIGGKLYVQISGSGHLDALSCPVLEADVHVSGSGKAKVNVSEKLHSHISGSGEIWYAGNPVVVENDITGSGSVKKI